MKSCKHETKAFYRFPYKLADGTERSHVAELCVMCGVNIGTLEKRGPWVKFDGDANTLPAWKHAEDKLLF